MSMKMEPQMSDAGLALQLAMGNYNLGTKPEVLKMIYSPKHVDVICKPEQKKNQYQTLDETEVAAPFPSLMLKVGARENAIRSIVQQYDLDFNPKDAIGRPGIFYLTDLMTTDSQESLQEFVMEHSNVDLNATDNVGCNFLQWVAQNDINPIAQGMVRKNILPLPPEEVIEIRQCGIDNLHFKETPIFHLNDGKLLYPMTYSSNNMLIPIVGMNTRVQQGRVVEVMMPDGGSSHMFFDGKGPVTGNLRYLDGGNIMLAPDNGIPVKGKLIRATVAKDEQRKVVSDFRGEWMSNGMFTKCNLVGVPQDGHEAILVNANDRGGLVFIDNNQPLNWRFVFLREDQYTLQIDQDGKALQPYEFMINRCMAALERQLKVPSLGLDVLT